MSCGTISGDLIYIFGVLGKRRVNEKTFEVLNVPNLMKTINPQIKKFNKSQAEKTRRKPYQET